MRCSRRRGVILYKYFSNGYFVAYTSPPPTAEPLLKEKPFGGRSILYSPPAAPDSRTQPCPRGTLIADQRRACAARPKGKNEESPGWSLLRTERFEFFPATGAHRWPGPLPVLFNRLLRHNAGSLLLSSLKKVTSPRPPVLPLLVLRQPALVSLDHVVAQGNDVVDGQLALQMRIHQCGLINVILLQGLGRLNG